MNSTVLYIEDNADNVRLVELLLKRRPHTELQVATNGRDGDGFPRPSVLSHRTAPGRCRG